MEETDFFEAHLYSKKFDEAMASRVPTKLDEEAADAAIAAATRNNAAAEEEMRKRKRGKKETSAPKAPRRNWTAYAYYVEEVRTLFSHINDIIHTYPLCSLLYSEFINNLSQQRALMKAADPKISFGEISRVTGQQWKSLSAEERARYEAMAEADKRRYDEEMRTYVPPAEEAEEDAPRRLQGMSAAEEALSDPKKKAKKPPFAPKGPLSAYFIYTNHVRPMVVFEHPDLSLPAITKEIASRWRALPPEEKAPFEEKSALDKRRYQMEMAAFKAGMM